MNWGEYTLKYKFRSNSDLYLSGDLRQMLPGVIAYGVQFDLIFGVQVHLKFLADRSSVIDQQTY